MFGGLQSSGGTIPEILHAVFALISKEDCAYIREGAKTITRVDS